MGSRFKVGNTYVTAIKECSVFSSGSSGFVLTLCVAQIEAWTCACVWDQRTLLYFIAASWGLAVPEEGLTKWVDKWRWHRTRCTKLKAISAIYSPGKQVLPGLWSVCLPPNKTSRWAWSFLSCQKPCLPSGFSLQHCLLALPLGRTECTSSTSCTCPILLQSLHHYLVTATVSTLRSRPRSGSV